LIYGLDVSLGMKVRNRFQRVRPCSLSLSLSLSLCVCVCLLLDLSACSLCVCLSVKLVAELYMCVLQVEEQAEKKEDEEKEDDEEEDDEEEDDEEEAWRAIFGSRTQRRMTLTMAGGGSHWWNYVLVFSEDDDDNYNLCIQNEDGERGVEGILVIRNIGNGERVSVQDDAYELKDDEHYITYN
jgi:hypothetical protein